MSTTHAHHSFTLAAALLGASGAFLGGASTALAHGSMSAPLSRIYSAFLEDPQSPDSAAVAAAIAVGGTQPLYDWNEVVNFIPGQPESQMNYPYHLLIPDGQIASGGNSKYAGFDLVRDDWPTTSIESGPYEMVFYATTPHDPSVFHAWITTADWTPALPLTWDKLVPLSIGPVMLMENEYRFNALIPSRVGKHCIYVIWQRLDPAGEGFYSLSDVDFGAGTVFECPADLSGDGTVDGADLAAVLGAWGGSGSSSGADLDGSNTVDGADLALILSAWGTCAPDCDGDGISDGDAIAAGAADCNANGVPDSCEPLADCDANGVVDLCAILEGTVADCNLNLIPDSCEIAAGGDANGDGFLDDCQLDGLTYAWSVTSQWDTGFVAGLTITNGSSSMIHGWTLRWDAPSYSIGSLWDGVLISQSNGEIVVANETWNGHLHPGDSVTVGFLANGTPTAPSSVIVNQSPAAPE